MARLPRQRKLKKDFELPLRLQELTVELIAKTLHYTIDENTLIEPTGYADLADYTQIP